jgi:VWFA-related protein
MAYRMGHLLVSLLMGIGLVMPTAAQNAVSGQSGHSQGPASESQQQALVLKSYSRMVSLDVVVEDKEGHHITGLSADDFRIFEQTPVRSREKRQEKIAEVHELHVAAMAPPAKVPDDTPGVYTNAVAVQRDPVPPTVLVVDGINTEMQYQAQAHKQMVAMLKQLPSNVPVAVFLMGSRLKLLQSFTTDPALLQKALGQAESATGQGLGHLDPTDDPDALGNQMYGLEGTGAGADVGDMIATVQAFDQMVYGANLMQRFDRTYDAFLSIARSLAGYPGRKNVLWLSTSFPLTLNVFLNNEDRAEMNEWQRLKVLNSALSEAKVAIYPVDIGGVRNLQVYSAAARPANPYANESTTVDALRVSSAADRQIVMQNNEQDTMHALADSTGGKVCTGDNDIAQCIRRAVEDSSDFYEISYYPGAGEWNGEYRRVFVEVKQHGARLRYREGYYATPEGSPDPQSQAAEMQKDCGDLLNATGLVFSAKPLPDDKPGQLRFAIAIDPGALTFTAAPDGGQQLNVEIGVCTIDRSGLPEKLMNYPLSLKLNGPQYNTLIAGGHLQDSILVPGPIPAAVRVMVKDVPSGRLGSVYILTGVGR